MVTKTLALSIPKLFLVCRHYLQHGCNVLCFIPLVASSDTSLQGNTTMRNLLLAATAIAVVALAPAANATVILNFGQTAGGNTVTGTANAAAGTTSIVASAVGVNVTQILGNALPPGATADFSLSVNSFGPATLTGSQVSEEFSGNFSIISTTAGPTLGKNVLSGTFTDAVGGGILGSSLTLGVSNGTPGEIINFTSDFAAIAAEFNVPEAITLSFTNVTPVVTRVGSGCTPLPGAAPCTIGSFSAAVSGNFSGTEVPEPASMALLGVGLLGLGFVANRKRSV